MIIFKSNVACIEQINTCFIKSDNTKDIAPKFFFNQQQQALKQIMIHQIRSQDDFVYFT